MKPVTDVEISNTIRRLRHTLGLTQEELARRLGKSTVTVQKYEQKNPPRGKGLLPLLNIALQMGDSDITAVLYQALATDLVSGGQLIRFLPHQVVGSDEKTVSLSSFMEELTLDEMALVGLWIVHFRNMPQKRVAALRALMESDLDDNPTVAKLLENLLHRFRDLKQPASAAKPKPRRKHAADNKESSTKKRKW